MGQMKRKNIPIKQENVSERYLTVPELPGSISFTGKQLHPSLHWLWAIFAEQQLQHVVQPQAKCSIVKLCASGNVLQRTNPLVSQQKQILFRLSHKTPCSLHLQLIVEAICES